MNESQSATTLQVAVIGGGLTGLAAAHRLTEIAPRVQTALFEAGDRVGGVIETLRRDEFLIERSADMFSTKEPWALELCRRVGIADQLINTNSAGRRAFVVHRGRMVPVPEGFTLLSPARTWPVIKTPLLSWRGKLRLGYERFVPARQAGSDESLAAFATRRLGREVYERLVQPLIGGIYTADSAQLSMQAALPEFVAMEREFGSLTRGIQTKTRQQPTAGTGARYGLFVAPRGGMSTLVQAIGQRLPKGCVQLNSRVERLQRVGERWHLFVAGTSHPKAFDAVIIATSATLAARLLGDVDADLSQELLAIPYASVAIPVLAYRRDQITHLLDGFGVVVPLIERRKVLSVSFASLKFPGRAPDDSVVFRVFIGGACQRELVELPEQQLYEIARQELRELVGVRGEPQLQMLVRWSNAMPQYHVGHLDRVARIESLTARWPGLTLAGNAYRGVGIPFCIRSGELAAERVVATRNDSSG